MFAGLLVLTCLFATSAVESVKINGKEAHPTRVLAKFKPAADRGDLAASADVAVQRRYSQVPGVVTVELADQAKLKARVGGNATPEAPLLETIKTLKASGLFEYVEPDYVVHADATPTDRAFLDGRLWGLKNSGLLGGVIGADINAEAAWDVTTGDTNVVICVIDTGVNYTHRDLAAQMWVNPGEIPNNGVDDDGDGYVDNIYGINAVADNGDPRDDQGHGTHCAGTIGAAANNNFDHVGVIWNVRIMALKFLGSDGSGFTSDAIECVNFSIVKKVRISSNSWGGGGFSQALLDSILAARGVGQIFIAAAGNDGLNNDFFPHFPSSYDADNIVSVAALDRADRLANFSNYGVNSVDIGGPGVDIFSTWFGSDTAYNTISGTSMATPHVAGVAGLILAKDLTSDYGRIRDKLLKSAIKIPSLAGNVSTGARVSAYESVVGVVDGILEISVLPPSGAYFATNTVTNILVRVTDDFNVNNATVVGRFNNQTLNFMNGSGIDTNGTDGIYTAQLTMPGQTGFYDLTLSISAPGKQSTNLVVTYESLARPANDDFERAAKVPPTGAILAGDNRMATAQAGEPLHGGAASTRSLWWSWSTPNPTPVIVDTAGTTFDDNAVLAIYNGSELASLLPVASAFASANGANGTRAPYLKFDAAPNVTYWIAVAQVSSGTNSPGRVSLRVEPRGDIDITPPTLRVTNYVSGVSIRSTTNSLILSGVANDPAPNASGIKDTGDGIQYKVNSDLIFQSALGSSNWTTRPIQLQLGVNHIYFKAFDRADNESALLDFTLFYSTQTNSNDLFGQPDVINIAAAPIGIITATNTVATKEFNEPAHAGNEGGHSIWYKFVANADGTLVLSTEGSAFDTLLAIYTVDTPLPLLTDLKLVAENDDSPDAVGGFSEIFTTVTAGRTYYIAVDGYSGRSGTVQFQYNFTPQTSYLLTTIATTGGAVTPPSSLNYPVSIRVGDTTYEGKIVAETSLNLTLQTVVDGSQQNVVIQKSDIVSRTASAAYPESSAITVRALPDQYKQFLRFDVTSGGVTTQEASNPYTFLISGPTTVTAVFTGKVFTDDFETANFKLPYVISSTGPTFYWGTGFVNTNLFEPFLGSRVALVTNLPNGVPATLSLTVPKSRLAPTAGSFEFSINTETNYDKFEFHVYTNNVVDASKTKVWSGYVPWTRVNFDLAYLGLAPTDLITFEWKYLRDAALIEDNELVAIDNLDLPIINVTPPDTRNVTLKVTRTTTSVSITATGPAGRELELQSSSNFTNWQPAGTAFSDGNGKAIFDVAPAATGNRFYRVKVQ
jgi:subtilisin family serine protease